MIVKICGIKDLAAMDAALEAGADMVGLVFFPASPRNVTPSEAAKLAERARGKAKVVALSVDAGDELIDAIETSVAPDMHQLHGAETPARLREIRARTGRQMMKAIPVATASDLAPLASFEDAADWILSTPRRRRMRNASRRPRPDLRLVAFEECEAPKARDAFRRHQPGQCSFGDFQGASRRGGRFLRR